MKKQTCAILVSFFMLLVSLPTHAADNRQAAHEEEIMSTGEVDQAVEDTGSYGMSTDDRLYASNSVLEKEKWNLSGCDTFQADCCDGSVYKPRKPQCGGWSNSCSCQ
ncbi:MAG: hypothetical protein RBT11_09830 [Desulfobacterales bacterium]|jgi:hypothetical protein|nr:hypothetical protein [Desulfobacterales bacterium]